LLGANSPRHIWLQFELAGEKLTGSCPHENETETARLRVPDSHALRGATCQGSVGNLPQQGAEICQISFISTKRKATRNSGRHPAETIERMQLDRLQPVRWPTAYADRILQAYSQSTGDFPWTAIGSLAVKIAWTPFSRLQPEHRGRPTLEGIEVLETIDGEEKMIRKLSAGKYRLYSRKKDLATGCRKNLGTFETRQAAEEHERAVQFFKRKG